MKKFRHFWSDKVQYININKECLLRKLQKSINFPYKMKNHDFARENENILFEKV